MSENQKPNDRRSGGTVTKIRIGRVLGEPLISVQCYERRHAECDGTDTFLTGKPCECACHRKKAKL